MIHSIELIDFLAHHDTKLDFSNDATVFVGQNGAGKSSIIDAIRENEKYFMNEILAINISYEVLNSKYVKNIELDGHKICLGIDVSR